MANLSLFLLFIFFSMSVLSSVNENAEFTKWESKILKLIEESRPIEAEKEFTLYLIAARELGAYGFEEKSQEYYLKAFNLKGDFDKSEAVIQLISLNIPDKPKLNIALSRAEKWFEDNPKKLNSNIKSWLQMIKGYSEGKTPIKNTGEFMAWAKDSRVDELISNGEFKEALRVLGPKDLEHSDINQKIRQDLLNQAVLGPQSPPLWCSKSLKKYPTSLTWSMRICRFLKAKKEGKKSEETIQGISEQMKLEESEHLSWLKILEGIK